jgi:Peptidase M50B-like
MKHRILKLSIFLFGSFSFSWVLGTVFHELGYAIAMWVTGGKVSRITINPFSWSYTYYASSPRYPAFSSWAGMLLG